MTKLLAGIILGVSLTGVSAQASLKHWTVRNVSAHFHKRAPGDRCRQIVYEDGSGTVCTRSYKITLDPK